MVLTSNSLKTRWSSSCTKKDVMREKLYQKFGKGLRILGVVKEMLFTKGNLSDEITTKNGIKNQPDFDLLAVGNNIKKYYRLA